MNIPTPDTDAALCLFDGKTEPYVPAETSRVIERERHELRNENRVLKKSLASAQAQLVKCQIQRERFHAQLRSKRPEDSTSPG